MNSNYMKKGIEGLLLVFLLSIFLPAGVIFAEEKARDTGIDPYIDIIVRYEGEVPDEASLDTRYKNIKTMDVLPIQTMSVPISAVREISLQENVRRITYDQEVETSQSTYEISSEDWNQDMVGSFDALTEGYTGKNVSVAILDTGFYKHPEITYSGGYSIFGEEDELGPDPWTNDHSGHGTHVAGIIGAMPGSRTQGVAPGVDLYGVKVYHESNGSKTRVGNLLAGLNWAIKNGSDIIVISSGYEHQNNEVHEVIQLAASKGIMTIAASGNMTEDNVTSDYPAAHDEVIAVSGVDQKQNHVSDSMIAYENELAAPGQNILSLSTDGTHTAMSGTSQAAPHVAGVAALLMEKYPDDSARAIRQRMIDCALDLGEPGRDLIYGYGLVQYDKKGSAEKTPEEQPKENPDETGNPSKDTSEEPSEEKQKYPDEKSDVIEGNPPKDQDESADRIPSDSKKPDESQDEKSENDLADEESSQTKDEKEQADKEDITEEEDEAESTDKSKDKEQSLQQKTVWVRPQEANGTAKVTDKDLMAVAENGVLAVSFDASLSHLDCIQLSREQVEMVRDKHIVLLVARADLEWVIPSSNLSDGDALLSFEQINETTAFEDISKGDILSFSIEQNGQRTSEFPSQMTYRFFTPAAEFNQDALYQWNEANETWHMLGDAYTKGGVVGVTTETPALAVFNPAELTSVQEKNDSENNHSVEDKIESSDETETETAADESSSDFPIVLSSIIVVIVSVSGGFYFFGGKN
ncbi:S8 family serine peptidase [Alkalibacterium kapii]|uniref:Peptidase S8/S53 domain-containing protein n=1 Tax=Alkalibacterium kapii TaxID=426704 RepID=A0A511ASC1_9LACT|nr:S8 family serine peptidase [Alkalibacterium kapii]GEK91095.1 hypothetical protein AKA01nite_07170 [Alkalibacterium kapii]